MRIAVISDIHGNLTALQAVADDLRERSVDRVLVLGDLSFKGPQPGACITEVAALEPVAVIQGNTDEWILDGLPDQFDPATEKGRRMHDFYHWTREQLDNAALEYLQGLPFFHRFQAGREDILCVHSTPESNTDWLPPSSPDQELETAFTPTGADLVLYGHVHVPGLRRLQAGPTVVNTGSVGLPFDGDPRAAYVLLDLERKRTDITFVRVAYDVDQAVAAARQAGMPWLEAYGPALATGNAF